MTPGGAAQELRSHPGRALVLLGCALAGIAHQATRSGWFIDDAAICFSYARNLAAGHGAVPWPGGERIEAISDPTWVALLALFQLVGLDGFTVAKPLAVIFGLATGWIVWRTARLALEGHEGPGALIAPVALAASAQFAIWSASGLENSLFCLLLAAAVHRVAIEVEDGHRPWSAVLYLLVAWTRPEGAMYAVIGAVVLAGARARAGRSLRPLGRWAAIVVVPSVALELARIAYFAWPFANTWYAKITARGIAPLDWDRRGWVQLREWADRLWYGYWTPLLVLGLTRGERRRTLVGLAGVGLLALTLAWPGTDELRALALWPDLPAPPDAWFVARCAAFLVAGALLPLLAVGRVALLCGWTAAAALLFGVAADGDWMGAYRWMSLAMPALSVLIAVAVTTVADRLPRSADGSWGPAGWVAASLAAGLLLPPNLSQTRDHVSYNTNETTRSVKLRVDYTRSILRTTFWDEPVTNIDVDMGAHLWWAPDYTELDMAMLVDVPMARHWFQQRAFVREHFFEEHRATFAHVGGWWALHSGLRRYPEWEPTFFELPGYQNVPPFGIFRNVFARRELVVADRWEGTDARRVVFRGRVALAGVEVPAPWVPGEPGYLEAPVQLLAPRAEKGAVRLVAFVTDADGVVASWDLPLGYGIYPWDQWKVGQVFRGRFAVSVPAEVQPGTYDLGFVLLGAAGQVLPAEAIPPGATGDDARFARGEVRFPGAVRVVDRPAAARALAEARAAVDARAAEGSCEDAESAWVVLKRHRPVAWGWHDEQAPGVASVLAGCWVARAGLDPGSAAQHLARAHRWAPRHPGLRAAAAPLADRMIAEGRDAMAREDWETAYRRFADVLRFAPHRAWARRWAEEARDHRLGLVDDVRIGIGGENQLRELEERGGR